MTDETKAPLPESRTINAAAPTPRRDSTGEKGWEKQEPSVPAEPTQSRNSTAWPEWAVRALCALARRILHEQNATCGKDWPAGQDWHELGHTSQHAFMRAAREEAGIPHDAYRDAVQAMCDSQEFDLDVVWADMDKRSEKSGYEPPTATASELGESTYKRALQRIAITDDEDCAHAKDPEAMKRIAREALRQ